jgi:hypothetical protein
LSFNDGNSSNAFFQPIFCLSSSLNPPNELKAFWTSGTMLPGKYGSTQEDVASQVSYMFEKVEEYITMSGLKRT